MRVHTNAIEKWLHHNVLYSQAKEHQREFEMVTCQIVAASCMFNGSASFRKSSVILLSNSVSCSINSVHFWVASSSVEAGISLDLITSMLCGVIISFEYFRPGTKRMVLSPFHAFVIDGLPANEINDTLKLILYANGDLDCSNRHTKLGTDLVDHAPRVRARSKRQHSQKNSKISQGSRHTCPSC